MFLQKNSLVYNFKFLCANSAVRHNITKIYQCFDFDERPFDFMQVLRRKRFLADVFYVVGRF